MFKNDIKKSIDALNNSRTAFESGNQFMEESDYQNAIAQYRMVISSDSDYQTAQSKIDEAVGKYRDSVLSDAKGKADSGDIKSAISVLNSGLTVFENDSEFTKQVNEYKKQQEQDETNKIIEKAKQSADNNNLDTAISSLKSAMDSYPDNTTISSLYSQYTDSYRKNILKLADDLIAKNDYDSAISKLQAASDILQDDKQITDKLKQVKENKPMELSKLKSQNAEKVWLSSDAAEDAMGNMYTGNNMWRTADYFASYDKSICDFYTAGNYKTITGILAPETSFRSDAAVSFEIYADGVLKYSKKIDQKTEPFTVSADITGAKWIEIRGSAISGVDRVGPLIFSNPVLMK
jgi:tetratricopeptide (TPR) repeat protein